MDYYSVLGVDKTATPDDIKRAYRKMASKHHPDKGGDTAQFQQIQAAYDTLSDPQKRQEYDNPSPRMRSGPGPGFGGSPFDIHDIFGQMFGQQRAGGFSARHMFRTQINFTLKESYEGSSQVLRLQDNKGTKVINIEVPKGVNHGDQVRYENIIENGTLLVMFAQVPDLKFDRRESDLICNQPISVFDLIVGGQFKFETISGKTVEVAVKPGTQPHMQLRLPGQGMPIPKTDRYGDQIVLLKPFIPDNIHKDIIDSILRNKDN